MPILKSNFILISLCFFISACQSVKVFNLKTFPTLTESNTNDRHVIWVKSDRVRQKCLFLNAEAENKWRHQYLMYVLNDENEVLEIMQPTNQDKDSCHSQMRKIEKILLKESSVKVCARDELKKSIQDAGTTKEVVEFGLLGNHRVAYEALTLDSICNSHDCHSNNDIWVNTCPGFIQH